MTAETKRRWDELKYGMEKNSFILSILESRIVTALYFDSMGVADSEAATIMKISPRYIVLIRSVRNRFPNDGAEELAQELFNMIYVEDNGYKRDYSHFQAFDTELLNKWHILQEKQQKLREERIALDTILTDAKHAYWAVHGKDIEWREIEEKPEQLEQQETEPESEPEEEVDVDLLDEFEVRLVREKLLCQMFKDGAINEQTALKYMGEPHLCYGAFLKIVEMRTEDTEIETDDEDDDTTEMIDALYRQEAQDELVCRMYKEGAISEDTAIKYTGGDLTHESFMKLVEIYTDEEKEIEIMPGETPEQAQARVDMGEAMRGWVADERREERLELLFELVQDGTMNVGNAFEYVPNDYGLDFDSFLRMQEAWEEERADE